MEISLKDLKELFDKSNETCSSSDDSHWIVGKSYLIRTVTMIQVGNLEKVTDKEIVLSNAAWIADTGRFSESIISGDFDEVEMFSSSHCVIVNRSSLIDAQQVGFDIQKLKTK
jgi:hypothetical protein